MNGSNNASNSRTDQFARNRFRSVTKDERLRPKPGARALDFSRLRFKSVYRKNSSTDQSESTSGDLVLSVFTSDASRTESGRTDSIQTGSIQSRSIQSVPVQSEPTQSDPVQSEPTQTDASQTTRTESTTRTNFRPNGFANLCLSLRSASDNPFFSGIEAMPDIRPRKKSIPLVSELVLKVCTLTSAICLLQINLLVLLILNKVWSLDGSSNKSLHWMQRF